MEPRLSSQVQELSNSFSDAQERIQRTFEGPDPLPHGSIPMLKTHFTKESKLYYSICPADNEVYRILSDIVQYKLHINQLTTTLRERKLLQFPELIKNT
jgi:hypothetical protein